MTRPPMDSMRVCVKCGSGQQNDAIGAMRRPISYRCAGFKGNGTRIDECLIRTCSRCGYEWEEACLDA